jgi:hypothetical protein
MIWIWNWKCQLDAGIETEMSYEFGCELVLELWFGFDFRLRYGLLLEFRVATGIGMGLEFGFRAGFWFVLQCRLMCEIDLVFGNPILLN